MKLENKKNGIGYGVLGFYFITLPYYLHDGYKLLFEELGYHVLWADNLEELEDKIRRNAKMDIAFEWQHGCQDHTNLNLVRKYYDNVPVILFLNRNGKPPDNFAELDYADTLSPVATADEVKEKFYRYCHHS